MISLRTVGHDTDQLKQQVTELQARVDRLEQACEIYDVELGNMGISCPEADAIANETPAQSLAAIQADAVEYATKILPKNSISKDKKYWTIDIDVLNEYANQLRQQGKDHD